ncbi:MAG TPA: asparaginase [Gaiellaceae bacterium]|nr:asparaginase [Gaiellaceae bacterium]
MDAINVAVTRGGLVESRHLVHAVVVRDGEVAEAWGDPDVVSFVRSAAKPLQALPLVPFELPDDELAIACASHEALPEQLVAVRALLARAGAATEDLECGAEHGSKLRHNCSGKHAGFLFLARRRGWPSVGYRLPEHPLQQNVRELVAAAVGKDPADLDTAVDGCGVPTFALSLVEMARVFGGLVSGEPAGADAVVQAMTAHPQLIGGPGAVDTLVMRALPGSVAKRGAEGVLCVGLADGTGVALKVDDGANRAAYAAAGLVLGIAELRERPVRNSRGETVGTISATA